MEEQYLKLNPWSKGNNNNLIGFAYNNPKNYSLSYFMNQELQRLTPPAVSTKVYNYSADNYNMYKRDKEIRDNILLPSYTSNFNTSKLTINPSMLNKGYLGSYRGIHPNLSKISIADPKDSSTITHELIHHAQHKDNFPFYHLRYLKGYPIFGNKTEKNKWYWNNPFEKEAFSNENNSHYLKTRPKNAQENYNFGGLLWKY